MHFTKHFRFFHFGKRGIIFRIPIFILFAAQTILLTIDSQAMDSTISLELKSSVATSQKDSESIEIEETAKQLLGLWANLETYKKFQSLKPSQRVLDLALFYWTQQSNDDLEILKLFIKRGAKIIQDESGMTTLHSAVLSCPTAVVKALLDSGLGESTLRALDNDGKSALDYAAAGRNMDTFKLLLRKGLKPTSKTLEAASFRASEIPEYSGKGLGPTLRDPEFLDDWCFNYNPFLNALFELPEENKEDSKAEQNQPESVYSTWKYHLLKEIVDRNPATLGCLRFRSTLAANGYDISRLDYRKKEKKNSYFSFSPKLIKVTQGNILQVRKDRKIALKNIRLDWVNQKLTGSDAERLVHEAHPPWVLDTLRSSLSATSIKPRKQKPPAASSLVERKDGTEPLKPCPHTLQFLHAVHASDLEEVQFLARNHDIRGQTKCSPDRWALTLDWAMQDGLKSKTRVPVIQELMIAGGQPLIEKWAQPLADLTDNRGVQVFRELIRSGLDIDEETLSPLTIRQILHSSKVLKPSALKMLIREHETYLPRCREAMMPFMHVSDLASIVLSYLKKSPKQ